MADYVFPMSDWMERPIAETYDASLVGMLPAGLNAVEPLYERRSDYDFYRRLGIECGQAEYWPEDNIPAMLDRGSRPRASRSKSWPPPRNASPSPSST